jgi:hypothetical protein
VNAAYDRPPQKITFGEMRDMGVRAHAPPIQGLMNTMTRPIGGIIRGSAATRAAAIRCP